MRAAGGREALLSLLMLLRPWGWCLHASAPELRVITSFVIVRYSPWKEGECVEPGRPEGAFFFLIDTQPFFGRNRNDEQAIPVAL